MSKLSLVTDLFKFAYDKYPKVLILVLTTILVGLSSVGYYYLKDDPMGNISKISAYDELALEHEALKERYAELVNEKKLVTDNLQQVKATNTELTDELKHLTIDYDKAMTIYKGKLDKRDIEIRELRYKVIEMTNQVKLSEFMIDTLSNQREQDRVLAKKYKSIQMTDLSEVYNEVFN